MLEWAKNHETLLIWVTIGSAVFFVLSLVVVGVVLVRLPSGYFQQSKRARERRRGSLALRVGKNILGWLLVAAGAAMLVLPGQGMLVLLIGIMLVDFPGKYRVERWIISRKKILNSANWLRAKFGRRPLRVNGGSQGESAAEAVPTPA